MPKRSSNKKDLNTRAHSIVQQVTGQAIGETEKNDPAKNPAAVALGRLGGLRGGKARAESLSKKRRSEIAKKAANSRWERAVKKSD